jgi:hypothetical protein
MDVTEIPAYGNGMARPNREQRRGFRREKTQLRLHFEGSNLDGLVAVMDPVEVGEVIDFAELSEKEVRTAAENMRVFTMLAEHLSEWNHEHEECSVHGQPARCRACRDEGVVSPVEWVPTPPTMVGVRMLDVGDAMLFVKHWMEEAASVPGPLSQSSFNGPTSPAARLPMDVSSPNPLS